MKKNHHDRFDSSIRGPRAVNVPSITKDFDESIQAIEKADERAATFLCASLLDRLLQEALTKRMRPELFLEERHRIFYDHGPLATFYSKIVLADALAIIDDYVSSDLSVILNLKKTFENRDYRMLIELRPRLNEELSMRGLPHDTRTALIIATKRIGLQLMDYALGTQEYVPSLSD